MIFKTKDYTLTYKDDKITKQKIFDELLNYFKKHESFCGESICQNDDPQINAPELLSEIADNLFKFNIDYNE